MIVVDSAAVVDALTAVDGTDDLRASMATEELCAPTLLDFEIVSALRGLILGGQLSATRAEDALTDFDNLEIRRWPSGDGLRRRALQLRDNVSAYDAAYVTLAEALDCSLLTRDARLVGSSGHLVRKPCGFVQPVCAFRASSLRLALGVSEFASRRSVPPN